MYEKAYVAMRDGSKMKLKRSGQMMKIYCSFCNDQLTKKDDIIEVKESTGFMHDSCYHKWLATQHQKRMISYDKAVGKVKSMLREGV